MRRTFLVLVSMVAFATPALAQGIVDPYVLSSPPSNVVGFMSAGSMHPTTNTTQVAAGVVTDIDLLAQKYQREHRSDAIKAVQALRPDLAHRHGAEVTTAGDRIRAARGATRTSVNSMRWSRSITRIMAAL